MKHFAKPSAIQLDAVDRNDPEHALRAITLDWPETFSTPAQDVIRYFDDSMFLFRYDDQYVVTDESLELTDCSGPIMGGPRFVACTLKEVEVWLEKIAEIANNEPGIMPGWEEMLDEQAAN